MWAGDGHHKCSLAGPSGNTNHSLCERLLQERCFFLHADFLLGQIDFLGSGGWKSSVRIHLGKQVEPKHVAVVISEYVDVQG